MEVATDELAWLGEVLGIEDSGPSIAYLGRPSTDDLRLILPTAPPAAAAAALRRLDDNRGPATVAAGLIGWAGARLGLLRLAPGDKLAIGRFELVDRLATVLGEPELLAAVTLGARRRNRKPVLQLTTPSGRIVGFAKVGWSPLTAELVANEADMLRLIEGRLPDWLRPPRLLHREDWRDGHVVVLTTLRPGSRLRSVSRALAGRPRSPIDRHAAMAAISSVDRIGSCPVGELPLVTEWGRAGLGEAIDTDLVFARHGETALDVGMWHGDFTPWNLRAGQTGMSVWDWEFAGRRRPIGFDALHHAFEQRRRQPGASNDDALTTTLSAAATIVEPLTGPVTAPELRAIVDLYLCELITRELRLEGQRWSGGGLEALGPAAVEILGRRLDR